MNSEQKNRLIDTILVLLRDTDKENGIHLKGKCVQYNMTSFAINEEGNEPDPDQAHACGTSCCIIGLGAMLYPEIASNYFSWCGFGFAVFGVNAGDLNALAWDFLFSGKNPSNPIDAANRVISYLLDRIHCTYDTGKSVYWISDDKKKLEKLLTQLKVNEQEG